MRIQETQSQPQSNTLLQNHNMQLTLKRNLQQLQDFSFMIADSLTSLRVSLMSISLYLEVLFVNDSESGFYVEILGILLVFVFLLVQLHQQFFQQSSSTLIWFPSHDRVVKLVLWLDYKITITGLNTSVDWILFLLGFDLIYRLPSRQVAWKHHQFVRHLNLIRN